uniref:Uncharacterized protein n=1 Tax=Arundo donax TaxID=35708 RepID=A0A0A9EP17_ARUDO
MSICCQICTILTKCMHLKLNRECVRQ